jgi:hypothetical protein
MLRFLKPRTAGWVKGRKMPKKRKFDFREDQDRPIFHPVEIALVSPLTKGISFDDQLLDECVSRGFIPRSLGESLNIAKFLGRTVLAAQSAQRTYGVPASFLISLGLQQFAWGADLLSQTSDGGAGYPGFDCHVWPGILRWFMETAQHLAESSEYSEAILFAHDVRAYAEKLVALGFRNSLDMEDVLTPIKNYDLEECDLAALRHPNEYNSNYFTAFRDEKGVNKLRAAWLDLVPLVRPAAPVPDAN